MMESLLSLLVHWKNIAQVDHDKVVAVCFNAGIDSLLIAHCFSANLIALHNKMLLGLVRRDGNNIHV